MQMIKESDIIEEEVELMNRSNSSNAGKRSEVGVKGGVNSGSS